jgi:uncharacterized membrane protein
VSVRKTPDDQRITASVPPPDDQRIEVMLGNLLRFGVLLSALVTAVGGGVYLVRNGNEMADYKKFGDGTPPELRDPRKVVGLVAQGSGRGLVQFGLLLLIATPVARVAFSALAFARQRDYLYVLMTLFVFAVLLFSLFHGGGG